MHRIRLVVFAVLATQLAGCLGTLKVLSAIGEADQQNKAAGYSPYPSSYPSYQAPQVVQPQVGNGIPRYICNTISSITTCKQVGG